jgi:release factor glutamine methyltransferase
MSSGESSEYRPMMSEDRVRRLREWQERAYEGDKRDGPVTVTHLGLTMVVPPDVYLPNPLGLAELVLREVREGDRVLDMGTGSGINALVAATKSSDVVAVDVNPSAARAAAENAERNNLAARIDVRQSDLFATVTGKFDVILFDPPFRWFLPRDMRERATADEDYRTLTAFFRQVRNYMTAGARILLSFGTTGDIDYLRHLIQTCGFQSEELRRVDGEKDGLSVSYFVYRLT